ncbi:MAG: hypothetical protein EOO77_29180 [Oxalobacteraceae bacterium]|nr:MAG: hypothetical protein EOO77_29180 [Oxalobacteraceae bacterium]
MVWQKSERVLQRSVKGLLGALLGLSITTLRFAHGLRTMTQPSDQIGPPSRGIGNVSASQPPQSYPMTPSLSEIERFAEFCVAQTSAIAGAVLEEAMIRDHHVHVTVMVLGSGQRISVQHSTAEVIAWNATNARVSPNAS